MQTDHLGSTRLMTAMNQSINDSMDFLPFGEQIQGGTGTTHKFTGKERDSETNLDDFGARYYSSQLGRFMSTDWTSVPAPVPYANFTHPQTLNLYAIVSDNPETFADLDGHGCSTGPGGGISCKANPTTSNAPAKPGDGQNAPGTGPSTTQQAQQTKQQKEDEQYHQALQEKEQRIREQQAGPAVGSPEYTKQLTNQVAVLTDSGERTILAPAAVVEGIGLAAVGATTEVAATGVDAATSALNTTVQNVVGGSNMLINNGTAAGSALADRFVPGGAVAIKDAVEAFVEPTSAAPTVAGLIGATVRTIVDRIIE